MTNEEPRGVGGWLLLFCIGQVLLAPARAFQEILQLWERIGPHPFPVVRQMADIIEIVILVVTVYGITVGTLVWRGKSYGRTLARQYLIVRIGVVLLISSSLTAWGNNAFGPEAAQRIALAIIGPGSVEIGTCLIWFAYFTYSRRVRNTYGDQATS
jgi:predicted Na+-dependent transporter